jgi:hypothetical protein
VAPVLDLGIGLAVMGIGVTGLAAESSCRPNEFCIDFSGVSHAGGVIFLAVGGLVVGSSVYGFSKTVSCRAVTDAQRECANGSAEACARLVPLPTAAPESKP